MSQPFVIQTNPPRIFGLNPDGTAGWEAHPETVEALFGFGETLRTCPLFAWDEVYAEAKRALEAKEIYERG